MKTEGREGEKERWESRVVQEVTQDPPSPGLVSLVFFLFLPCPESQPPAGMSGG